MIDKTINAYTIPIDKLKKHLNIDLDYVEDDDKLKDILEDATEHISNLISSDIELTTNKCFSKDKDNLNGIFYTSPFISITSLKVDGVSVNVDDLTVIKYFSHFQIEDIKATKSIEIEFITGYEKIPNPLKRAIIIYSGDLYDTMISDTVIGMSVTSTKVIERLTAPYKRKYW